MRTKRAATDPVLPQASTKVGLGSALHVEGVDGRSAGARRYREIVSELRAEVTQMKRQPTTTEMMLIRRAAFITMWLEKAEAKQANGEPVDISEYTNATLTLRKTMGDLDLLTTG